MGRHGFVATAATGDDFRKEDTNFDLNGPCMVRYIQYSDRDVIVVDIAAMRCAQIQWQRTAFQLLEFALQLPGELGRWPGPEGVDQLRHVSAARLVTGRCGHGA